MPGTFGKYRLIELLGRGGMGEVWRAYDSALDRVVAIKILPADTSADPVFQQRFRREAYAAARLNSPHVIPIHTHGVVDGRLFVDMRLIDGRDLQRLLAAGPLPPGRAVHIIEQVAKALHAAHRVGLLHRDVKPSNILLDDDDFAYLIDFGLARTAGEMTLTSFGEVVGTFHYMAPERFTDDNVDARSDVYALACVLYETLTGRRPFSGHAPAELLTAHLHEPPPRPSHIQPGLPEGFDAVIATGMAKRPDQRYPTTMDLARAARDALATATTTRRPAVSARPPSPLEVGSYPGRDSPPPGYPPSDPDQQRPSRPGPEQRPVARQPPPTATRVPAPAWCRRKPVLIAAAAAAVVATVIAVGFAVTDDHGTDRGRFTQSTLPFTGLDAPEGLSVGNGGTVYVADPRHNRILALAAGSTKQAVLRFDGLSHPTGVAADESGTVYVTDAGNKRVVILPAGSAQQTVLPFTDLADPTGVTVDSSRTVYVSDTSKNQVLALPADSDHQTVLPFTGLNGPTGVVVNSDGTVYVADGGNDRVLALPADSGAQSALPFTGLREPGGVAVDGAGAVYVTDRRHNRVLKLPVGSTVQTELPFTGLEHPRGLAVDSVGTVYVAGNNDHVFALRQK